MPTSDDSPPYRHDTQAAYERIALLEAELARIRGSLQSPQSRALASLHVDHLREDRADLIVRFRRRRSVLFVTTGLGMIFAFAYFLVQAGLDPAAAREWWIACGAAVTAVAASGWIAQASIYARTLSHCRRVDRRIAEEHVLAGMDPSIAEASRVRVATEATVSPPLTQVDIDPLLAVEQSRAATR